MGAWGSGPLENDTAADWCGDLGDAHPGERAEIIMAALERVVAETGYLEMPEAEEAVAAAVVVAASLGGESGASEGLPEFLAKSGAVHLPESARGVAVAALERVVAEDSEWRDLWGESNAEGGALVQLGALREQLTSVV